MDVPRSEARLVGGQVDRKRRDLLRRAEAAHGLAVDEGLAHRLDALAGALRLGGDALVERRRPDRAGAELGGGAAGRSSSDGDWIGPGQIALARMPRRMKSAATALVSPITAALLAP